MADAVIEIEPRLPKITAREAVELTVAGAFHSRLMESAYQTLRQALEDHALSAGERDFLAVLRPALEEQAGRGDERVFVGGAAMLLDAVRGSELDACRSLLAVLERRAATLELLRASIEQRRPYVRVGEELDNPALSGVSLVGARYGLAHRSLGTVSLLGPMRMDYEKAIGAVRAAAQELSRFVEDVYEEP